ncbi:ig-like domain-containing protein [Trichonephila inaurata madagascariensis]|uniref:Ig-like domain-containing protein n=1 Tax=Trichonephila inaurata madagascariensis TaxID=2747483 RepID=A0A8X7C3H7_9ARAC|nr:ig-like domain-containing protein [Trichonephila inaurata madagascariensis]
MLWLVMEVGKVVCWFKYNLHQFDGITIRPLVVKISGPRQPFSAGARVQLKCSSQGSRPPAVITWKKAGSNFKNPQEEVVTGGNATVSMFFFTPTPEDHGHYVTCRAENPLIPGSDIEDKWKMEVHSGAREPKKVHLNRKQNFTP